MRHKDVRQKILDTREEMPALKELAFLLLVYLVPL